MATSELQVINAVLKNKDIGVLFGASVDDLFVAYGDVWDSIKGYHARYHSIPDIEVIQQRFPDLEEVSVPGETAHYVDTLKAEFIEGRMQTIMTRAAQMLQTDTSPRVLEKMQAELHKLDRFSNAARDLNVMDFEAAEAHYAEVRARAEAHGGTPGIPTGISFIDSSYTSGWMGGDLIIVLGWTGRAKSLFTTLVSCNAHQEGHKPMIVSMEMSGAKVRDRIYTIMGSGLFQNSSLALGDIGTDDFRSFASKHAGDQAFVVVTNDGVGEMTPNIVQAKIDQHKPSMVVFDYAQLASDNANSLDMTARMRNMSREYKMMATQNDIPIALISSATPEKATSMDEPPMVEQVAWSKQLSYDADLSFAVHKHTDSNWVEIVCRKNRNGPLFAGYLDWDIDSGRFEEKFFKDDNA